MEIRTLPPLGGDVEMPCISGGGMDRLLTIARSWIGTPYVHQASLKGVGCDCLGLLRGIQRELMGGELEDIPPYDPAWDIAGAEELRDGFARHFQEIARADVAPGDFLLFRMSPNASARHCGLLAEKAGTLTLIHARQNKRVSEEPFTPFWQKKLAYVFRIF